MVARFPEDGPVEQHERVGGEDPIARVPGGGGGGFLPGEPRRRGASRLARQDRLVHLGRTDSERNSERGQDLRASGG